MQAGTASFLFAVLSLAAPIQAAQEPVAAPSERARVETWHETALVGVKFREGLHVRLRAGALSDEATGALDGALEVLAGPARGVWHRTHGLAEADLDRRREEARERTGRFLPDLNLHFRLVLEPGVDAARAIDALNALECVESAWPVARPMPPPSVPDFTHLQGYLGAAPQGMGVRASWPRPAAQGRNVRIVDIEYAYEPSHVDLPPILLVNTPSNYFYGTDHGTAVLGQLFARPDGEGTTGMAYGAQAVFSPASSSAFGPPGFDFNPARAITDALVHLSIGDVYLLEQQTAGPNYNPPPCCASNSCAPGTDCQAGLVPMEWDLAVYDATRFVVGLGMHVVAAAGNGSENLSAAIYTGYPGHAHAPFLPANDSGALIVGAGASPAGSTVDRSRLSYSNYGATVDLQGWGENVATTGWIPGFAGLHGAPGGPDAYMSNFSGTSSASPFVAAAVAILASTFEAQTDWPIDPATMRDTLRTTGSVQTSGVFPASQNIGPRPNLPAALARLQLWRFGDDDSWQGGSLGGPSPRRDAAMTYDSARGRVVLFGGDGGGFDMADLWFLAKDTLTGQHAWTSSPTAGPSPRSGAAMAYDEKRDRYVLFGGSTFGIQNGETWEFDPKLQVWSLVGFGLARSGHALAYDPIRERTLLVGGNCGSSCGDTWEWDGSNWQLFPGPFPSGFIRPALAWDSDRSRMVFFGGHDPLNFQDTNVIAERVGTTWLVLGPASGPSPRSGAGLAYDTSRRRCVLFGGIQSGSAQPLSDTWEWNGSAWHQDTTSFPFFARARHGLAYDQSVGRLLGFGGDGPGLLVSDTTLIRDRYHTLSAAYCFGDGSGAACPCGNTSSVFAGAGCTNSLGKGGKLRSQGQASLFHPGASPILIGSDMPNSAALYYQGTAQQSGGFGAVFGDGLRCVAGSIVRLGTQANAGNGSVYPNFGLGDLPIAQKGLVTMPGIRTYQVWYRNPAPFCTSSTFNLSNGLQVVWGL